jgi:phosphate transport system substrate-binding protein
MRRITPRTRRTALQLAPLVVVATLVGIAAGEAGGGGDRKPRSVDKLTGSVSIDGTVALLGMTESAARAFERRHPGVRVTVGASGDQNAIDSFCAGEVDIAEVARPFRQAERRDCKSAGIWYMPIGFAREGIALVVSDKNTFARCLTLDQVRSIWRVENPARSWADVDPAFPALELEPIGWKPDSPPYTLMAAALFGPIAPLTRDDFEIASNAAGIVQSVGASPVAVGFLPLGDLVGATGVRAVSIEGGHGCVAPTAATVGDGRYPALSRPLDLDVNTKSLRRPEVRRFIGDYLRAGRAIRSAAGVVGVPGSHRLHGKFTRP